MNRENYFIIEGKYNKAKVFSQNRDEKAAGQIEDICSNAAYRNSKIRIMPDYHPGLGSVIGFTATLENRIIPNTVGVDINCGMYTARLGKVDIDFRKLDNFIRSSIPHGFKHNKSISPKVEPEIEAEIRKVSAKMELDAEDQLKGIGSLGGGNHFIEINQAKSGDRYLVVHSGSRNFGLQVCNYHQQKAYQYCQSRYNQIEDVELQEEYDLNKSNSFLEGEMAEEYYRDMKTAQKYADLNRKIINDRILDYLGITAEEEFQTRHNYINFDDGIIRKGAVSAHKGEKILIPLNMRDGSILAEGLGNEDWNYSAPHGAGRVLSRTQAKKQIDFREYKKSMRDIFTTSVSKKTLDESPFAYKPAEEIIYSVSDTIKILEVLKTVYNFKSS
ncbi:MAG: RtcB family protein [Bacillota bacterium]